MSVLPVSDGLVLDLQAAALTPGFGGVVGGWPDSSPARNIGYLLDTLPTWIAVQTPAGGPAVRFAGQSQLRYDPHQESGTTNPFAQAGAGAEIFAVLRATPGVAGNPGFYMAGGGDYGYYPAAAGSPATFDDGYRPAGVDGAVVDGSFSGHLYTIAGISTGQWHVYNVYHDGGERVTSVDGVVVHRVAVGYHQPAGLLLGAGLHGWSGDLAQFCAYQRALTGAERQRVLAYLSDLHFTVHPGDPDPGTPPTPGPAGLTLISTVTDAFDGATLDPIWYCPGDQYALGGAHLRLDGVLQTASAGYNIDSAFVKAVFASLAAGDDGYLSYTAGIPFGSPPTTWGINIHAVGGGPSEISATWTNEDGASGSSTPIPYDPLAHAYLRLSSVFAQVDGDWYLTMICEAGPAPGQWTLLLHSPQIYTSATVADGFQIVLQAQPQPPVYVSNFNVAAAATSQLWMKMPDGAYRKAGVAGQPFSLRMPDGSMRTWPGAGLPLYMRMPDGSWRQVLS